MNRSFFRKLASSRIHAADVGRGERALGYFLGPCLMYMVYNALAGTYLTQFYTDVLGLAGSFLTLTPLLSKLLCALTSFLIGRMIDRTRTSQGKARPYLPAAGLLMAVCGFLLYAVPRASYGVQIAWIVISYNLFFALAFSVYSLSHSLMVPLSTRNTRQRDALAMLTSTATTMIPGMLSTLLMPLLIRRIGVGADAQGGWLALMGMLSALAIPAAMIEYYFTLERVTAESSSEAQQAAPFRQQIAACFRSRYWVMVLLFALTVHLCTSLSNNSMLYYCNWVLGDSIESGASRQILVNMIGQAPLGFGALILWPLVNRFGKQRVAAVGFSIAALGSCLVFFNAKRLPVVLVSLFIRSLGTVPIYIMASLLAEALDHVEQMQGFRADGFSASVHSVVQTVVMGLGQTLVLAGIQTFGYVVPSSAAQVIAQPQAVQTFFSWCFAGLPMIGYLFCALILFFL